MAGSEVDEAVVQGYLVFRKGSAFHVRGLIDGVEVTAVDDAGAAIEAAVAALGPGGGEIVLGRGDFPLAQPVTLHDDVWLHGGGRGTRLIVAPAVSAGVVAVGAHGIEISNLALVAGPEGAPVGLLLDGCGDVKVRDLVVVGFDDYGIWMRNHGFLCEVRGCSLAGNGKAGIYVDEHRRGVYGDFVPNLITNCFVYGGGKGIDCNATTVLNIVACAIYQTGDVGIYIHDTSYSVLVSGCRTFQITGPAVKVARTGEVALSSNVFCWQTEDGIVLDDVGWGVISGNEIIDSGSYNPGTQDFATPIADVPADVALRCGIVLQNARGITISANTIFNWPQARRMRVGILEEASCRHNQITGNSINYYRDAGIVTEGEGSQAGDNLLEQDRPHDGNPHETMHQSFRTELTATFVERVRWGRL